LVQYLNHVTTRDLYLLFVDWLVFDNILLANSSSTTNVIRKHV
jgi:hypothetical protein